MTPHPPLAAPATLSERSVEALSRALKTLSADELEQLVAESEHAADCAVCAVELAQQVREAAARARRGS